MDDRIDAGDNPQPQQGYVSIPCRFGLRQFYSINHFLCAVGELDDHRTPSARRSGRGALHSKSTSAAGGDSTTCRSDRLTLSPGSAHPHIQKILTIDFPVFGAKEECCAMVIHFDMDDRRSTFVDHRPFINMTVCIGAAFDTHSRIARPHRRWVQKYEIRRQGYFERNLSQRNFLLPTCQISAALVDRKRLHSQRNLHIRPFVVEILEALMRPANDPNCFRQFLRDLEPLLAVLVLLARTIHKRS